jgi:hypothetical protein
MIIKLSHAEVGNWVHLQLLESSLKFILWSTDEDGQCYTYKYIHVHSRALLLNLYLLPKKLSFCITQVGCALLHNIEESQGEPEVTTFLMEFLTKVYTCDGKFFSVIAEAKHECIAH